MEDDETMVDLGGIKVPPALKARFDELIAKQKELKAQLFESKTALQEYETAAKAPSAELTAALARVSELEAAASKGEHTRILAADGLDADEELYDYLQMQYGKVTPAEGEGKEKASFTDWYAGAKTTSSVIRAAVANAAASKAASAGAGEAAPSRPAGVKVTTAPKVVATPSKVIPAKTPGPSEVGMDASAMSKLSPESWKANREAFRKSLFGGS